MKHASPYLDTSEWDHLYTFVAWTDPTNPMLFRFAEFIDAWDARNSIKLSYVPWTVTDVYQMY